MISDSPALYLGFASLHLLVGHLGAASLHWARFRRNPLVLYRGRASDHQRTTRAVSVLSALWGMALVASALSARFRAAPLCGALWHTPESLSWAIAAFGLVLMAGAQASMGAAFRVGQDASDPPPALRTGGLHALSRNPIYAGSWTYLLGMTLWHPSPLLLGLCLGIGACIHDLVLAEERFLAGQFGDAWTTYRARTPRYLPGLP